MYHYKHTALVRPKLNWRFKTVSSRIASSSAAARGNTQGLARMVIGCKADEVAQRLEGIPCRGNTSCPDQLSKAIHEYHE